MYLEFLGAQSACSLVSSRRLEEQDLAAIGSERIYLMDVRRLYLIMFPMASIDKGANEVRQKKLNSESTEKMLFFAANWAIEQATEYDLELYLCWFNWFGSQLEPFCSFFYSFLDMLKNEELKHPIWKKIFRCREELLSHGTIELEAIPVPILSMDFVDFFASDNLQESHAGLLMNSIKSVPLLRLSYQQWRAETHYVHNQRTKDFVPILNTLRMVEKKVLELLVESASFDVLFQLYNSLLEHHILFWNGVKSLRDESYAVSLNDYIVISWRSLLKKIGKIKEFCPEEVDNFWVSSLLKSLLPSPFCLLPSPFPLSSYVNKFLLASSFLPFNCLAERSKNLESCVFWLPVFAELIAVAAWWSSFFTAFWQYI